jgi:hypothetical protein
MREVWYEYVLRLVAEELPSRTPFDDVTVTVSITTHEPAVFSQLLHRMDATFWLNFLHVPVHSLYVALPLVEPWWALARLWYAAV